MKRSIFRYGAFTVLLAAVLIMGAGLRPQQAQALNDVDQANGSIGSTYNNVNVWNSYQTFTPSKQYLTAVSVYIAANSFADTLTISIIDLDLTVHSSTTLSIPSGGGAWRTVSFAEPIDLYAGASHQHGIKVTSNSSNSSWNASDSNTYSGGCAYKNWVCQGYDLVFITYGYDAPVTPGDDTPDPAPGTTPVATTTSTVNSGNTPATTTSATIAPATNLKAEYASTEKTVNLSWTKSASTDVTGYRVFRSEVKGKSYIKIGQTTSKVLTYADKNPTPGKTYYYIVRAIKNAEESINSNEASLSISEDGVTAKVNKDVSKTIAYTPLSENPYKQFPLIFWVLTGVIILLDAALAFIIYRRHKAKNSKS